MKSKIIKSENINEYKLEIYPFEDDEVINVYKTKKRELYELYIQLRDIFQNEE